MIRTGMLMILLLISLCGLTQSSRKFKNDANEISQIKKVIFDQAEAWSAGDLELFMQGYWKSDSLMFVGSNGITYGWDKTLANYKQTSLGFSP